MAANRLKLNADKTELLWASSKYNSAFLVAADRHYSSVTRPSQPVIMCASSMSSSHLTSALTSTFHIQVQRAFTGFVRFEGFVVLLTLSLQGLWYTPLSHPVLIAAMPCWPGRQEAVTGHLQYVLNSAARVVSGNHKFKRGLTHLLAMPLCSAAWYMIGGVGVSALNFV